MSITECITHVSVSPTNGANARRPDALGETITYAHDLIQRRETVCDRLDGFIDQSDCLRPVGVFRDDQVG